ncbi:hypothetical protein CIK05_04675 [Bdellovibrio sp. qaytius]|nr:hypothetical protein CIK05_04675 [Bdellovibrio sp. qaytius]
MKAKILLPVVLMLAVTLVNHAPVFAQEVPTEKSTDMLAEIQKSRFNQALNKIGIADISIEGEANFKYNTGGEEHGIDTDGPEVVLGVQSTNKAIRAEIALAFQELISIDKNKLSKPMDWNAFLKEAKIIIDKDPSTGRIFTTIIGKQTLSTSSNDSVMPIDDNGPLKALTEVPGAYAIQFQLDKEALKVIDSLIVSGFTTGKGSEDAGLEPNTTGGMVVISKKLSDSLILNGSLTRINHEGAPETRINWGAVYTNERHGYSVFFNQAIFKHNPLYPESSTIYTLGATKQIGEKGTATVEATGGAVRQFALGYTHQISKKTLLGVGVRKTICTPMAQDAGTCGVRYEALLKRQF